MQHISYQVHVTNKGWMNPVKDGEIAGTVGRNLAVECLRIVGMNIPGLGINGFAHVQDMGWSKGNKQGEDIGTTGKNKHIEAIRLDLFGEKAKDYQLWYRVHVQDIGFMDWVRQSEVAGTTGGNKQIEAIQIILAKASENIWLASNTTEPYRKIEKPKPQPTDKTQALLNQARSYLGYVSGDADSIFGEGDWCCHFVRTCCWNAGVDFPDTAWVPYVEEWAKENGKWAAEPRPGYAVLFDFNGNGTPDHIGFVEEGYSQFHCLTIEGNTGEPVGCYERDRSEYIYGYVALV